MQQNIIQFDEGWSKIHENGILKLEKIIENGMRGKITNKEYAELYTIIYQMCTQQEPNCYSINLYEQFENCIDEFLKNTSLSLTNDPKESDVCQLRDVLKQWNDFCLLKRWLVNFFVYLNRFYVKRYHKKPLETICYDKYREIVYKKIKKSILKTLLHQIEEERNGKQIDRMLIRDIIQIYISIDLNDTHLETYQNDFEKYYLRETFDFYSMKVSKWLETDDCVAYLKQAQKSINEEAERARDYLHISTGHRCAKVILRPILLQYQSEILEKKGSGFVVLLQRNAREDLKLVYSLYKILPLSLIPIGKMFRNHISECGFEMFQSFSESSNITEFIEKIIQFYDNYHSLVTDIFENNPIFDKAFKEAFENVLNQKLNTKQSFPELLSIFCNLLLSKNAKNNITESEIEKKLDKIINIFSYVSDKDLFQEFYRKFLAKRLLMGNTFNTELEKNIIGKLKIQCGAQFTSKLEGMMNDIKNADEHKLNFKQYLREFSPDTLSIDLEVQVLTTTYWPTYKDVKHTLHQSMVDALDHFQRYYDKRTSNRVLKWVHSLGLVVISANFPSKKVYLEVSTIQACILMVLNTCSSISIEALHKVLHVPIDVLKRQLKPLVHKKFFKILNKTPPSGYDPSHMISINMQCNPLRKRIRIPLSTGISDQERDKNMSEVNEERKHTIEASIMRIMKTRKRMTHQELMAEVSSQLLHNFKPDPRVIKTRIEDLIGRDYLVRDSEATNVYEYLA